MLMKLTPDLLCEVFRAQVCLFTKQSLPGFSILFGASSLLQKLSLDITNFLGSWAE